MEYKEAQIKALRKELYELKCISSEVYEKYKVHKECKSLLKLKNKILDLIMIE